MDDKSKLRKETKRVRIYVSLIGTVVVCILLVVAVLWKGGLFGRAGVEFRARSSKDISVVIRPNHCGWLHNLLSYEGRIYLSKECVLPEALIDWDQEPVKIYTNRGFVFADVPEMLYEVAGEGNIYAAKGYDKDFRMIVEYTLTNIFGEENTYYKMFDCLNGIYMKYGEELYRDRLHVERFSTATLHTAETQVELSVEETEQLIELLCEAKFMEESQESADKEKELNDSPDWTVVFNMPDGTLVTVQIDEEGYAMYTGYQVTEAIVQMDAGAFGEIKSD